MDHDNLADFIKRIGYSTLAAVNPSDGVRANWDELPVSLAGIVKGKPANQNRASTSKSGSGSRSFSWKDKKGTFLIEVYVSGTGATGAHQALLARASATMMMKIPYERRPAPLGDLAIHDPRFPSEIVMWVYRNVFVLVSDGGTASDVGPAAQAIQRFMEAREVPRLVEHLPVVEKLKVSPDQIRVGDVFQVTIVLGKNTALESVTTDFSEVLDANTMEDKLEFLTRTPLTATFKAEKAGQTHVDVPVMDRKTLLSPPLSVTINVLPAN